MSRRGAWHPLYLDGPKGALFAIWHRPAEGGSETVLYLPPFAEEMNRSRRTISMLGRAMATRGLGLFVLDLYGTGDSAGTFDEASWSGWLADASAAIRFIEAEGHHVEGTLGLRTGALLALATARAHGLKRAVLCQPVEDGRTYLTGLMRSRIAAAQAGDGPRATIPDLRAALADGRPIEIMGYALSPALCSELEVLSLADIGTGYAGQIDWLHLAARSDAPLPQKATDEIGQLAALLQGRVSNRTVTSPSFWLLENAPPADRFIAAVTGIWHDAPRKETIRG